MIHSVKIDERYYHHVRDLQKNAEVRYDDRDYQVGDEIEMRVEGREWLRTSRRITHVLRACDGLHSGYVVLSLDDGGKLDRARECAHKAEKSNAPLRGTITRLQRELAELRGESQ